MAIKKKSPSKKPRRHVSQKKSSTRKSVRVSTLKTSKSNFPYRNVFYILAFLIVAFLILNKAFSQPQAEMLSSQTLNQYVAKEGYAFSYPKDWKLGEGSSVVLSSDRNYINSYKNNSEPSVVGAKADWVVEKDIVPAGTPLHQALQSGANDESMTLLENGFLTINGIPAYRQVAQSQSQNNSTKTAINYNLLKGNTLYKFNCEVDSNNPQQLIQACDNIAKSFKLIK